MRDLDKVVHEVVQKVIKTRKQELVKIERERIKIRMSEFVNDQSDSRLQERSKIRAKYTIGCHNAIIVCEEELPTMGDVSQMTDKQFDVEWKQWLKELNKVMAPLLRKQQWIYVMSDLDGVATISYFYNPRTKLWYQTSKTGADFPGIHGLRNKYKGGFPTFAEAFQD